MKERLLFGVWVIIAVVRVAFAETLLSKAKPQQLDKVKRRA